MWPRLSTWRRAASRSSSATTASFVRAHASTRSASGRASAGAPHALPQRPAGDQRGLDHLGPAGGQLGRRQRGQDAGIGEHGGRLVVGAGVVLALGQVDAGLAAVGGVDLRDERGRHLHHRHAALVDRGAEAREVADDAAAERHHVVVAGHARRGQGAHNALDLRRASCAPRPAGSARRPRRRSRRSRVQRADRLVGDEEGPPRRRAQRAAEQALPHVHRVVARGGARPHEPRAGRGAVERAQRRNGVPHGLLRGLGQDRVGERLVDGARLGVQRRRTGRDRAPAAGRRWRAARPCRRRRRAARRGARPSAPRTRSERSAPLDSVSTGAGGASSSSQASSSSASRERALAVAGEEVARRRAQALLERRVEVQRAGAERRRGGARRRRLAGAHEPDEDQRYGRRRFHPMRSS